MVAGLAKTHASCTCNILYHSDYIPSTGHASFLDCTVQGALVYCSGKGMVEREHNSSCYHTQLTASPQISQHALNSFFALFEILVPRTSPPPLLHLLFLIVLLALYLALAYITRVAQGWYPYSFLDPKNGSGHLAAYIVGILAAACILFGIIWVVIFVRDSGTTKLGFEGKFVRGRPPSLENLTETGVNVLELKEVTK